MSGGPIVAVMADPVSGQMAAAGAQPTAEQVARFQQLLDQPNLTSEPAYYTAPRAEITALGSDFHAIVDYVGQANTRFNAGLSGPPPPVDLHGLPPELQQQLELQRDFSERMRNMSNATLEFEVIGKGVQLAEDLPKVLYQQG